MSNPFISLEDEIQLRLSIKAADKHEGMDGLITILGELGRSMEIVCDVAREIMDEENKKNG